MCGRERLAGLTARAVDLRGGGRGGLPELSGIETAALLKGLNETATALALYRYCGNEGLQPFLFDAAYLKVVDLVNQEKWEVPTGESIYRIMTKCALFEIVEGNGVCRECNGQGVHYGIDADIAKPVLLTCPHCRGVGRARLKAVHVARAIKRSEKSYHDHWKSRYLLIADMLVAWVNGIECDLSKALAINMKNNA